MEGPRGTKKNEFGSVMNLVNSVFRPEKKSMQEEYAILFNRENLENMRIILEDGKPVSHAGISERDIVICGCRSRVGSIGAVCTDPEYRNKGYSTIILKDAIRKIDRDGADFMLVSGDRNLYDRLDCMRVGKVCKWTIRKTDLGRLGPSVVQVRDFARNALQGMMKVYNREPVRYIRPVNDWNTGVECGQVMNRPCTFATIYEGRKFRGYVVIHLFDEGTSKIGDVMEYAGSRKALFNAIPSIFKKFNLERLSFNIPFQDGEFIKSMREKNLNVSVIPVHGTVRIVNFTRLMQRLAPYFRRRIGRIADSLVFKEENGRFIFELGRERVIIPNRRVLAWWILGTPEGYMISGSGGLENLLGRVFPIPFVWPGMNYV